MQELERVLDYIVTHKAFDKVFKGWSEEQLRSLLIKACQNNTCSYYEDSGVIKGVVVALPDKDKKEIRIIGIISDEPMALMAFLRKYAELYFGYVLTAKRHGKEVKYDLSKLNRLWKNTRHKIYSLAIT